jgi:Formin Homology 2 Domain
MCSGQRTTDEEAFLLSLADTVHLQERLRAVRALRTLLAVHEILPAALQACANACSDVHASVRRGQLMHIMFASRETQNYMNESSGHDRIWALDLTQLLQLKRIKGTAAHCPSLLHWVAEQVSNIQVRFLSKYAIVLFVDRCAQRRFGKRVEFCTQCQRVTRAPAKVCCHCNERQSLSALSTRAG